IDNAAFTPFSNARVDGLAFAPDGTLWGTAWPRGGQLLRFNSRGRAEIVLTFDNDADGLAFGAPGTATENLLFVSHSAGGTLTAVDLTSLQFAEIATGSTRGDFLHVDTQGRLFATLSDQVVLFDLVAVPRIVATTPVDTSSVLPVLTRATISFSTDMSHNDS